ncbi:MAG: hypothetical protein K5793_04180 [Nitrosarchaeum sp.]|nr:hypothetical protein [Nitrosarchaeum sp.]
MKYIIISLAIAFVLLLIIISVIVNNISDSSINLSFWLGIYMTSIITIIAILTTLLITDYYHNKKPESDAHFDIQKTNKEEDLRHRVGIAFSWLKQECGVLLDKSEIFEHDLIAFGHKNYDQLLQVIDGNSQYVRNNRLSYLDFLTNDEFDHHRQFFHTMARFVRRLQIEKHEERTKRFDDYEELAFELKNLNEDLKIIKDRRSEYEKYSHIISGTSIISRRGSLLLKGIKYYKAPCSIY